MHPTPIELAGTVTFGLAILHTFLIKRFQHWALKFPEGSLGENFFHLLGEIEIVFGFWAGVFLCLMAFLNGFKTTMHHVESLNFTEAIFVFAIMTICATKPILELIDQLIRFFSKLLPLPKEMRFYCTALILGPLLGSFITEPAAMTVTALLLKDRYFDRTQSEIFKYLTLAVLFVNVSIGGTLTPYAAPPILMVAAQWNWDLPFMVAHFGWKSALACCLTAFLSSFYLMKELKQIQNANAQKAEKSSGAHMAPLWINAIHILFLILVVISAHHSTVFMGLFLFFLGFTLITREFQTELKLKESLLVGFFLAGLIVFGGEQRWWVSPILNSLGERSLFLGATGLTAFTDNAALTYLGAQVQGLTDGLKLALVSGAVAGGGLTVIANAPNPAGFAILKDSFGKEGISPIGLFAFACLPTLVAMACLWWLPAL